MRDVGTKADNVGDVYSAGFFNSLRNEVENPVTGTGQTLNPEAGPDTDLDMLGKAMAVYGAGADGFQDSGGADAYVLSRSGGLQPWPSYRNGVAAVFKVGTTNTGASTVNVSTLGVKSITNTDGTALVAGIMVAGSYVSIRYNLSDDRFEIDTSVSVAPKTTLFAVGGSWTKPNGLKYVEVTTLGGGGAGGGVTSADGTAGGAGGGGCAISTISAGDLSSSETVTVGAGGTGSTGTGTDGGTSSFGSLVVASGGVGAAGESGGGSGVSSSGGEGTTGTLLFKGSFGYNAGTDSGGGGASFLGGHVRGKTSAGVGLDGQQYGGGGGGAKRGGSNVAGGDGADGVVIVKEFF